MGLGFVKRSEFLARFPPTPPPPHPPATRSAPFATPPAAPAPSPDDYFARVEVRPPTFTTAKPPKPSRKLWVAAACAVVIVGGGAFVVLHGASSAKHEPPVVLAPRAATAAIPGSLSDVVRIQAEANRHAALQTVEQVGSGDPHELEQMQQNFRWVDGSQASTGPSVVSVAMSPVGDITVAVSASNKDVCAFGRWSKYSVPEYVSMAHLPSCDAADAPLAGWSHEAGGAASDLPDESG